MKRLYLMMLLNGLALSSIAQTYDFTGEYKVNGGITIKPDDSNTPVFLNFKRLSDGWNAARIGQVYTNNGFGAHLTFETNSVGALSSLTERMRITQDGNVGIGTSSPQDKLHVYGNLAIKADDASSPAYITFRRITDGWIAARMGQVYSQVGLGSHLTFETNASSSTTDLVERMRITYTGNVLVGKTTQSNNAYKLDVNGSIRSNEVVVNTTGADFVFEDSYKLMKLEDVERYIEANNHLPEIKSAAEMQENGLSVGETETKLLQKVEELTLYMIELNKKVNSLIEENERLKGGSNGGGENK